MPARPRLFYVSTEDPERSLDDPGLAHLSEAGWTVAAAHPVMLQRKGGGEEVRLMLVLWPPARESSAVRVATLAAQAFWALGSLLWIVVAVLELVSYLLRLVIP